MRKILLLSVAAAALPFPAAAQTMNAEAYHSRMDQLLKRGPLALFAMGEIKLLTNEATAAGHRASAIRAAALKAGTPPRFCPPPGRQSMGRSEFMSRFNAIPQGTRARIDMTEAMTLIFETKYPCR